MTKFARVTSRISSRWRYIPDPGRDVWGWGVRVKRRPDGTWLLGGDCEDFCFRVVWAMEGSKDAAIDAIARGEYVLWWATTKGDGGLVNHLVLERPKAGQFCEVIFGRAVKRPNEQLGTIRLKRKVSIATVLSKLGYLDRLAGGDQGP